MSDQAAPLAVSFDDIRGAAAVVSRYAHRTPVHRSRTVDTLSGATCFLKCENFQRTGSFKFRGAINALSCLDAAAREAGVLAYSSGNHAQAIARAAQILGIPATIVMPTDAPASKLAATREYGARVIPYDRARETREAVAASILAETPMTLVPPFDHPDVIAGQGTCALEFFEEVGPLDYLFVAVGGGGLLSGSALVARALYPACRVIGVEPAAADDAARSLYSGILQENPNPPTIADGVRTTSLGALTFPIVRACVDAIVTIPEDAIARATLSCFERLRMVIEPTGALALAPLLERRYYVPGGARCGAILCGGNVDLSTLAALANRR